MSSTWDKYIVKPDTQPQAGKWDKFLVSQPPAANLPTFITNEVTSTANRQPFVPSDQLDPEARKVREQYLLSHQGESISAGMPSLERQSLKTKLTPEQITKEALPLYQDISRAFPSLGVATGVGQIVGGKYISEKLPGMFTIMSSAFPEGVAFNYATDALQRLSPKSVEILNTIQSAPEVTGRWLKKKFTGKDLNQLEKDILAVASAGYQYALFHYLHKFGSAFSKSFRSGEQFPEPQTPLATDVKERKAYTSPDAFKTPIQPQGEMISGQPISEKGSEKITQPKPPTEIQSNYDIKMTVGKVLNDPETYGTTQVIGEAQRILGGRDKWAEELEKNTDMIRQQGTQLGSTPEEFSRRVVAANMLGVTDISNIRKLQQEIPADSDIYQKPTPPVPDDLKNDVGMRILKQKLKQNADYSASKLSEIKTPEDAWEAFNKEGLNTESPSYTKPGTPFVRQPEDIASIEKLKATAKSPDRIISETPVSDLHPEVTSKITDKAQEMLNEVESSKRVSKENVGKGWETTNTQPGFTWSSFPEWFTDLGKNRDAVVNALRKIVAHNEDSEKLAGELKGIIFKHLSEGREGISETLSSGGKTEANMFHVPKDEDIAGFLDQFAKRKVTPDDFNKAYDDYLKQQTAFEFGANAPTKEFSSVKDVSDFVSKASKEDIDAVRNRLVENQKIYNEAAERYQKLSPEEKLNQHDALHSIEKQVTLDQEALDQYAKKPKDLQAAVLNTEGKPEVGEKHPDIETKMGLPNLSEEQRHLDPRYGFVDENGKFVNREDAMRIAKQKDLLKPGYENEKSLQSHMLKGQPDKVGVGAAFASEFEKQPVNPTSLKNAQVDAERQKRGLPPAMKAIRETDPEVWDRAMKKINDNPGYQDELIKDLKEKPRALSPEDNMILLHRQVDLQNEYEKAVRDQVAAFDNNQVDLKGETASRLAWISDQLLDLYNIGRKVGTESGRSLRARQVAINEDFSLASMELQKRAANGGRQLTMDEQTRIQKIAREIKSAQQELDQHRVRKQMSDEQRLAAWKKRTTGKISELEKRIETKDFSPKAKRPPIELDREGLQLQARVEELKRRFRQELLSDRMQQRSKSEKAMDWLSRWRRMQLLSSPIVLAKLTSAAAQRLLYNAVEEGIGKGISEIVPKVAEKASREGGYNVKAEVEAVTQMVKQGMPQAWQYLKTGQSNLDVLYGKQYAMPQSWMDFFGHIHGALKEPVRQSEFARSFEKRLTLEANAGNDISDPMLQMKIGTEAYKDANRAIFMNDNRVVSAYKMFLAGLESKSKITGKPTFAGKAAGTVARVLLPIVKVPTNIVAETLQYSTGLFTGGVHLAKAFRNGVETLRPEEADLIMRQLKKGSIGGAVMLLGYLSPQTVGGFYQAREKRQAGEVKAGDVRLFGQDIPAYLLHSPLMETLQIGATVRRVQDSFLRKSDVEPQGLGSGIMAGGVGLLEDVPFTREMWETQKLLDPRGRQQYLGELARTLAVPQAMEWLSKQLDKDESGQTTKRKPENYLQEIEMGIPGLRQTVPASSTKTSNSNQFIPGAMRF